MLVLARGRFGSGPARVLQQVQRSGTVTREDLSRITGLSPATVARTVGVMVDECLLREPAVTRSVVTDPLTRGTPGAAVPRECGGSPRRRRTPGSTAGRRRT